MTTAAERAGYAVGVACIVLGGLVAAAAGPLHFELGSWLAAYLVLVCGVAQCLIAQQPRLCRTPTAARHRQWVTLTLWNGANTLIITGSLTEVALISDVGGALLIAALVLAAVATRRAEQLFVAVIIRVLYALLAISIPIGLVLVHLRTS